MFVTQTIFNYQQIKSYIYFGADFQMDYFNSTTCHIAGQMDIDAITPLSTKYSLIVSLGSDDLIRLENKHTSKIETIELPPDHCTNHISIHPHGDRVILGGKCKQVFQYSLITKQKTKNIYESFGTITDIKYSLTGRYISVASSQQKVTIIDTVTNKITKCRPGHSNKVITTYFSRDDKYIASIGEQGNVLIYELSSDKDPVQVYRTQFTKEQLPSILQSCFNIYSQQNSSHNAYVPGCHDLQIIQQLSNHWDIKKTNIGHSLPISIVQVLNEHLIVTACARDLCIWNLQKQEKHVVLEQVPFAKIVEVSGGFIGHCNDGNIYCYNRALPIIQKQNQHIQNQEQNFVQKLQDQQQQRQQEQQNVQLQYEQQYHELDKHSKKRKVDKLLKVLPQESLQRGTTFFNDNRFAYINMHGYVIQSIEQDNNISVTVEFTSQSGKQHIIKNIFSGKQIKYYDLNHNNTLLYGNQNIFGLYYNRSKQWERQWYDIQGVALSGTWLAIANTSEIKFFDLAGNQTKSICFNRPIVAMQAYQNLLAVVYHQGIPLNHNQVLSMKIFRVDPTKITQILESHVPLNSNLNQEKGSFLRWFGFSNQGMIFSQDSLGQIRAFSLQAREWTLIYSQDVKQVKKVWIVGFKNYQMIYWKTTDEQPQPTVRPRLNVKIAHFTYSIIGQFNQSTKQFPTLMWKRYCLDHQLARWRMWYKTKINLKNKHVDYQKLKNVMDQMQLYNQHIQLDKKYYQVIKDFVIKEKRAQKALHLCKAYIRTGSVGRHLVQLFDESNYRHLAIDLQVYYQEKQKQIEYQAIQQLQLKDLKLKVQISVKSKKQNPMNPRFKKTPKDTVSFNMPSQPSQVSSIMEDITHRAPQNNKQDQIIQNPFLKKKSTVQSRKQEIEEQIEKYGVKRKVQEKKKTSKI